MVQADWAERFKSINWWDNDKVTNAYVMVIGAGALGNEVIKNLTLLGVGNIFIIDFDFIEYSNLSRSVLFRENDTKSRNYKAKQAAKRAKAINPNCRFATVIGDITTDVGLGIFKRMDAIVSCVDSRYARLMINRYCFWLNKSWVNGGLLDAEGMGIVYKRGVNDYESNLTDLDWKNIRLRQGCPDIARSLLEIGSIPTTPVSASIIGAFQSQEVLKLIHGYEKLLMAGKEFRFNLMRNEYFIIEQANFSPESESNLIWGKIETSPLSSHHTVNQLFIYLQKIYKTENIEIILRNPIITKVRRESDNQIFQILVNETKLADYLDDNQIRDNVDELGRNRIFIEEKIEKLSNSFAEKNIKLSDLGIPNLEILQVCINEKEMKYIELTKDEKKLKFK